MQPLEENMATPTQEELLKAVRDVTRRFEARDSRPPPEILVKPARRDIRHLNDRLAENDPELVRLDITASALFDFADWEKEDFLAALQSNITVSHVHLSGDGLEDVFTEDQVDMLLEGIGYLENLSELFVFRGDSPDITGKRVAHCLALAKKLRVFMMWGFAEIEEEHDLAGAIRNHQNLERVTITLPSRMKYACLDVFIMGMASMRKLKCLCIRCKYSQADPVISPEAIPILFASPTLESLYLEQCGLQDDHSDAIAAELTSNKILTLLDLKHNHFSDDALYTFAQKLPRNQTLTSLDLSGVYITEGGVLALAGAMKDNHTLKHLELEGTEVRYADEFDIPDGHKFSDYMQALDFRLRLNRAGKGESRQRFCEALNSVSDHLDCIYHLVRGNAHYCERPAAPATRE